MLSKDFSEGFSFTLGSERRVGFNQKEGDSQGKKFLWTQSKQQVQRFWGWYSWWEWGWGIGEEVSGWDLSRRGRECIILTKASMATKSRKAGRGHPP